MAKAKWLENSTNRELIDLVLTALNSGDEKEVKKAIKAAEELIERTPDTDGQISVAEALEALKGATVAVEAAYAAEVKAMEESAEDVDTDDEEEDIEEGSDLESMSKKELVALAKELGIKNPKKKEKEELIELITEAQGEADDEEDEDEEDEVDYSEMSKKDLIALAKERGLKVNKKMKPADIIELLEADDEE